MKESTRAFVSADLIARRITCDPVDVAYVKSIVTAYDGLCCLFSNDGHDVQLVSPRGREAELDLLVSDLEQELDSRRTATFEDRLQ